MKRILAAVAAVLLLPAPAFAAVKVIWNFDKSGGTPALYGQPDEEESDQVLSARCMAGGHIDLRVGAYDNVGKGSGEAVAVTLTSGGKSATLKGKSQNSDNFQMTADSELRTTVGKNDPVFAVLATGKPITANGVGDQPGTDVWGVTGLQKSVAAFLAACGNQ